MQYRDFILFLLLIQANKTFANQCEDIFIHREYFEIKEDPEILVENLDIHGRPFTYQITQSFKANNQKYPQMSLVIDKQDVKKLKDQSKNKQRIQLLHPYIVSGLSINESFLQFIHKDIHSALRFLSQSKLLSSDELLFVQGLQQVIQQKPKLIMLDDEKQFDSESGVHRFAKTRGYPGDPIYFNSHQLKDITSDLFQIKEQKIDVNSQMSKEKEVTNLDLNFDVHYRFTAPLPEELQSDLVRYSDKAQLDKVLTIYFHELGHFLGMKDDPQQSLSKLSFKLSQILLEDFQQINYRGFGLDGLSVTSFKDFSQSRDRLVLMNMDLLFDLSKDLELHLQEQLGVVPLQWRILNLRILPSNNQKSISDVPTQFFEFEIEYVNEKNQPNLLTVSYQIDLIASMEYRALSQHRQLKHYMGPVDIRIDDQSFSVRLNRIESVNLQNPHPVEKLLISKLKFTVNQQIEFSAFLQLPHSSSTIDYVEVRLSPIDGVKSGVIESAGYVIKSTKYEYIGSDRIIVHFIDQLPQGMNDGKYIIDQFKIHLKNEQDSVHRLKDKTVIEIVNQFQTNPALSHYGFTISKLMKHKKNRLLDLSLSSKLTNFKLSQQGVTIPLVFFVQNVGPMSEFRLTGQFITEGEIGQPRQYFSFNELYNAQQKGPLIQKIEVTQKGHLKQIVVFINVPKHVRSRFVQQMNIQSLYIRDRNLNELLTEIKMKIFTTDDPEQRGGQ